MTSNSSSLDSDKHNRNRFCGRWTLQGKMQDQGTEHWRYTRLGCKRWTCPRCGLKKAQRLRRAIIHAAIEKGLNRFLTLTLDPITCTPQESVPVIRQSWNKFRTYLKRQYGTNVSFITILELNKSGYAHLHILIDRYIPQAWISESWRAVGGGKIVFITQVDIHRVAGYLSKYLTKDLLLTDFNPKQRRYTTSRDIILFVKLPSGNWALLKEPLGFLYREAQPAVCREERDEEGILQWFETLHPI